MFTIIDEDISWALSVACPWTISGPGYEHHWEDGTLEEAMDRLIGARLIRVEIGDDLIDPVFHFDNLVRLSIQADSDLDPWVFRLQGMELVLVGLARHDETGL